MGAPGKARGDGYIHYLHTAVVSQVHTYAENDSILQFKYMSLLHVCVISEKMFIKKSC